MSKNVLCGICMTEGDFTAMKLRDVFFVCPACGTESWPKDDEFVERWKQMKKEEMETQTYVSLSLPEGVKIPGGEQKSGKLPDRMKKASLYAINMRLYDET